MAWPTRDLAICIARGGGRALTHSHCPMPPKTAFPHSSRRGTIGAMDDRRKPSLLFWIAIAVPVVMAALVPVWLLWTFGVFGPPDVTAMAFEPVAWQRADPIEKHRTVRSQMIDDLMRRKLLDGLSRAEVEQLLGPSLPDIRQHLGVDPSHPWDTAYYLGIERAGSFSLDDEFLVIRFDDKNHVAEYRTTVN